MEEELTFKQALERGLESDDEGLVRALNEVWQDCESAEDAELLVQVLARLPVSVSDPSDGTLAVKTALRRCDGIEDEGAMRVLQRGAQAHLLRLFDALIGDAEEDTSLFRVLLSALKLLAVFETPEGVTRMLRAARIEAQWGNIRWDAIFWVMLPHRKHPWVDGLVEGLKDEIPDGLVGVLFLDLCNLQYSVGQLPAHPFNSPLGVKRMTSWLNQEGDSRPSYAVSTCSAIAFLPETLQAQLTHVADHSPEPEVRITFAKARIEANDPSGFDRLKEVGDDPRYAMRIIRYLREHGAPPECFPERLTGPRSESFVAEAELCEWLAHPNEFGRPPQKIHEIDSRKLYWPPSDQVRSVYLFRYEYPPQRRQKAPVVGVGMVGGATVFSLVADVKEDMKPEEMYALHCAWELEITKDKRAPEQRTVQAGLEILRIYNEGFGT